MLKPSQILSTTYRSIGLVAMSLVGCNMATPPSKIAAPHISSEKYEQLECPSLKSKVDELSQIVQELAVVQESRVSKSKGHLAFYGWGSGDGMETIELVKMKGELSAAERAYENKRCAVLSNASRQQ